MIASNASLQQLTAKLSESRPDWDKIVPRFRENEAFMSSNLRGEGIHALASNLGTVHLQCALEELCGAQADATYLPTIEGETDHYTFKYARGRLATVSKSDTCSIEEIDAVAIVGGVPVLFKVKLNMQPDKTDLILREERIKRSLQPLMEKFDASSGYVLMKYPSSHRYGQSSHQTRFRARGGIVIPFYTDAEQYLKDVRYVKARFRI